MSQAATAPRSDRIDSNISDLFFNTRLDECVIHDASGNFTGYDEKKLHDEAGLFLGCLTRLGVDVPTCDDLIADFYARL